MLKPIPVMIRIKKLQQFSAILSYYSKPLKYSYVLLVSYLWPLTVLEYPIIIQSTHTALYLRLRIMRQAVRLSSEYPDPLELNNNHHTIHGVILQNWNNNLTAHGTAGQWWCVKEATESCGLPRNAHLLPYVREQWRTRKKENKLTMVYLEMAL